MRKEESEDKQPNKSKYDLMFADDKVQTDNAVFTLELGSVFRAAMRKSSTF